MPSQQVNVASIAGIEGLGFAPIYAASKHAVVGLSKSVAREQAPRNIRVNIVAPGSIHTPLLEEAMKDRGGAKNAIHKGNGMERVADPMEIANVIGFLLSSESSFVTGAVFTADGGLTAGQ
jgi:NAD(P)-dependent dehydrogenase (short-subunit alcohol dehydrogenase family)